MYIERLLPVTLLTQQCTIKRPPHILPENILSGGQDPLGVTCPQTQIFLHHLVRDSENYQVREMQENCSVTVSLGGGKRPKNATVGATADSPASNFQFCRHLCLIPTFLNRFQRQENIRKILGVGGSHPPSPKNFLSQTFPITGRVGSKNSDRKNRNRRQLERSEGPHSTNSINSWRAPRGPREKFLARCTRPLPGLSGSIEKNSQHNTGKAAESGKKPMGVWLAFRSQTDRKKTDRKTKTQTLLSTHSQ
jgi:hypothetical protein